MLQLGKKKFPNTLISSTESNDRVSTGQQNFKNAFTSLPCLRYCLERNAEELDCVKRHYSADECYLKDFVPILSSWIYSIGPMMNCLYLPCPVVPALEEL